MAERASDEAEEHKVRRDKRKTAYAMLVAISCLLGACASVPTAPQSGSTPLPSVANSVGPTQPSPTRIRDWDASCKQSESLSYELEEGTGYSTPDEALEEMGGDAPPGDREVAATSGRRRMWVILDAKGDAYGEIEATRGQAGWVIDGATWCVDAQR